MRRSLFVLLVIPFTLLLAACDTSTGGTGGGTPAPQATKMPAEAVGENLLGALRDTKTTEAWDIVSTGRADQTYNGLADFTAKMIEVGRPASWTFEPLKYDGDDTLSWVILSGPVTFDDDATGRVTIQMSAVGLLANPWRVDTFVLERD